MSPVHAGGPAFFSLHLVPLLQPTKSYIQVIDEGLIGALIHFTGLTELDHVQVLGLPEV